MPSLVKVDGQGLCTNRHFSQYKVYTSSITDLCFIEYDPWIAAELFKCQSIIHRSLPTNIWCQVINNTFSISKTSLSNSSLFWLSTSLEPWQLAYSDRKTFGDFGYIVFQLNKYNYCSICDLWRCPWSSKAKFQHWRVTHLLIPFLSYVLLIVG